MNIYSFSARSILLDYICSPRCSGRSPTNLRIRILLHATRDNELDSVGSPDENEKQPRAPDSKKKDSWAHTEGITTRTGRPDLRAIVTEEIQAATNNICIFKPEQGSIPLIPRLSYVGALALLFTSSTLHLQ